MTAADSSHPRTAADSDHSSAPTDADLRAVRQRLRAELSPDPDAVLLNTAGIAPLCRPARRAIEEATQGLSRGWFAVDALFADYSRARAVYARLCGARPQDVAMFHTCAAALSQVALGLTLRPGWESFVGAGPLPMRHGMTMGELARWFVATLKLDVECEVIAMEGWQPDLAPGYGWPIGERSWINPSPNAPNLSMARAYAGTVMLEGTTLSEGRGTTRPLELFGAPDLDARKLIARMEAFAPKWLAGCRLRECWFEPTFHKHAGMLCNGVQIHVEDPTHYDHAKFRPWRLQALAFKAIRQLRRDYPLWRDFPYEYEHDRLAIDLINGSEILREWVDDATTRPGDLDALAQADEREWEEMRRTFLLY